MKIKVSERQIILEDAPEYARGLFNSIPGARYNRGGQWSYPRSPFVMKRLTDKIMESCIDHRFGTGCDVLVSQMRDYIGSCNLKALGETTPGDYQTQTQPWEHQRLASGWLSGKPFGYLAMKMGTGKTLVAINELIMQRPKRTLILCPKTVIDVWLDEMSIHAPDHDFLIAPLNKGSSVKKAEQASKEWRNGILMKRPLIVIVNYETAWREAVSKWIMDMHWEVVIADEAHKIKAPGSRVSRFAAGLSRRSDTRLLLSGTPLPNNQLDAYGQYRFMDPGIFGTSFARFRAHYAEVVTYKGFPEIAGWRNQEEFKRILELTMFRVDEDVLDLPPLTHVQRHFVIPPKAQRVYDSLMKTFVADVESGEVTAGNALVRLLRFQQITSGFIKDDEGGITELHNEKRDMLAEIIDNVMGEPVVVFCRFRHDLEAVREVAKRAKRVYGEVSGSGNVLVGGRIPDGCDVLGVQIQAGGVGVNLNASRLCVFYSLGFSLAEYEQAVARLHRGGQENPVTVYHLIARGTVDEQVYGALAAKKKVVDAIMAYVKGVK